MTKSVKHRIPVPVVDPVQAAVKLAEARRASGRPSPQSAPSAARREGDERDTGRAGAAHRAQGHLRGRHGQARHDHSRRTVATASDTVACDVGIRDGRIAALGDDLGTADEIIDARGKLVLPGGIDSHVHFAQPSGPGIVMADDFESGTRSAAFGGNTLVMPFCLQQKGESLRQAVKDYHAKADGKCHIDVSFHLIISDPTPQVLGQELPALVADGYTSFKVFMTYQDLALSDIELLEVFSVARETGALVMVHAENYDAIRFLTERLERAGKTAPNFTRRRGRSPSSARRRTAPSRSPSWSTCRS